MLQKRCGRLLGKIKAEPIKSAFFDRSGLHSPDIPHCGQPFDAVPLLASDCMGVAGRGSRIAPVAGRYETLNVSTSPTHPRRKGVAEGVAEGVEVDPCQPVIWRLPPDRTADRAGETKCGELGARQQMLEVCPPW